MSLGKKRAKLEREREALRQRRQEELARTYTRRHKRKT